MAVFKYDLKQNQIHLEFKIEQAVLEHFDLKKECENYEQATAMCLTNYILSNTQFEVNGTNIDFVLQSAQKDEDFYVIELVANQAITDTDRLSIWNQCFVEFDQEFENRIIIAKGGIIKSYRLNQKNKEFTYH